MNELNVYILLWVPKLLFNKLNVRTCAGFGRIERDNVF
jgi:hypothetical protein